MSARRSPAIADASIRRARFAVPIPQRATTVAERVRLVDPTGMAVAWLDYGDAIVVRAFYVRNGDASWQEVVLDRAVAIPAASDGSEDGTWGLVERDPTMAHLRWQGNVSIEIQVEVVDRALMIVTGDQLIVVSDSAIVDH